MFILSEAEAAAIRAIFHERGEFQSLTKGTTMEYYAGIEARRPKQSRAEGRFVAALRDDTRARHESPKCQSGY